MKNKYFDSTGYEEDVKQMAKMRHIQNIATWIIIGSVTGILFAICIIKSIG